MIPPGATIGILGGGQLGRMTALAAARLGYRVHVFAPELDNPTEQVCAAATHAAYDDIAVGLVFNDSDNDTHPSGREVARIGNSKAVRTGRALGDQVWHFSHFQALNLVPDPKLTLFQPLHLHLIIWCPLC